MNRPFLALFALLAAAAQAQTPSYVDIREVSGSALIQVDKVEDFAALIKDHKIKEVFRTQDQFLVQLDSVLYSMDSSLFRTIQDYRAGKETFGTGDIYYVALAQGLSTKAEVDYFNGELFLSGDDFKAARKAGFCNNESSVPRGVAGLLRAGDLERNLPAAVALLAVKRRLGDKQVGIDDLLGIKDTATLAKNSYGAVQAVDADTYYVSIAVDWLTVSGTGTGNAAPAPQPVPAPAKSEVALSDAVFYYLARLGLYPTFAEAQTALKASIPSGAVLPIAGTGDLLKKTGFKSLSLVPPAVARGFSDGVSYGLAMEYNLADSAEYRTYERRIAEYEKLRSKYDLKTRGEAEVATVLLDLPKRVPVSFGRFAEQFNTQAASDPLIKRGGFRIDETYVSSLLVRASKLSGHFVYDKGGKSLYRK